MPAEKITQDRYDDLTYSFAEMQKLFESKHLPPADKERFDEWLHALINGGMQELADGYKEALRLASLSKP